MNLRDYRKPKAANKLKAVRYDTLEYDLSSLDKDFIVSFDKDTYIDCKIHVCKFYCDNYEISYRKNKDSDYMSTKYYSTKASNNSGTNKHYTIESVIDEHISREIQKIKEDKDLLSDPNIKLANKIFNRSSNNIYVNLYFNNDRTFRIITSCGPCDDIIMKNISKEYSEGEHLEEECSYCLEEKSTNIYYSNTISRSPTKKVQEKEIKTEHGLRNETTSEEPIKAGSIKAGGFKELWNGFLNLISFK